MPPRLAQSLPVAPPPRSSPQPPKTFPGRHNPLGHMTGFRLLLHPETENYTELRARSARSFEQSISATRRASSDRFWRKNRQLDTSCEKGQLTTWQRKRYPCRAREETPQGRPRERTRSMCRCSSVSIDGDGAAAVAMARCRLGIPTAPRRVPRADLLNCDVRLPATAQEQPLGDQALFALRFMRSRATSEWKGR